MQDRFRSSVTSCERFGDDQRERYEVLCSWLVMPAAMIGSLPP